MQGRLLGCAASSRGRVGEEGKGRVGGELGERKKMQRRVSKGVTNEVRSGRDIGKSMFKLCSLVINLLRLTSSVLFCQNVVSGGRGTLRRPIFEQLPLALAPSYNGVVINVEHVARDCSTKSAIKKSDLPCSECRLITEGVVAKFLGQNKNF